MSCNSINNLLVSSIPPIYENCMYVGFKKSNVNNVLKNENQKNETLLL